MEWREAMVEVHKGYLLRKSRQDQNTEISFHLRQRGGTLKVV